MSASLVLSGRGQGAGRREPNEEPPFVLPPPAFRLPPAAGFALVATLLMIAVITGAAVAFFQSTRIERFVTRNYADLARAQLAAEGGAAAAQALITTLFTNYPDSAVGWARLNDTELATFYFRTTSTNGFVPAGTNSAVPGNSPVFLFAHPLASGANEVSQSFFTTSSVVFTNTNTSDGQAGLTVANRVDLNADNWIGTPPGGSRPALRAKWVEILQNPSQPKNTNLNSAGQPSNPAIARYAFWAEDESFRVNINQAGATSRATNTPGAATAEIALQGALADTNTALARGVTNLQISLRTNIPTPGMVDLISPMNNYATNRFVISVHSSALNLSRGGTLRLNLNQVVSNASSSLPNYSLLVRTQLNRILSAITNSNSLAAPSNTAAMPLFGQRFYRLTTDGTTLNATSMVTGTIGTNQRTGFYLQKIAANIRDYIDSDSLPTVVNNDPGFTINNAAEPWNAFAGGAAGGNGPYDSSVAAIGKEAVPLLTEYAVRVLLTSWQINGTGAGRSANFVFRLFHYFEFWNPTTKDIPLAALGNNPRLQILNMYGFNVGTGGSITPSVPPTTVTSLSNFSGLTNFPANSFTVLTTEPPENANTCPFPNNASFKRASNSFTEYRGTTRLTSVVNGVTQPRIRPWLGTSATPARAGTGSTDYDLWMTLFNSDGVLESFTALPTGAATGADPNEANALTIHNDPGDNTNSTTFKWRSGSLRGNDSLNRSGEPRSLHEQMRIARYLGSSDPNQAHQTRFFTETSLANVSLGQLNGAGNYINPTNWIDYSPAISPGAGASLAPYRQLDGPLDTISRLGDLYDPALFLVAGSTEIALVRGGGRTLKIGQAERWGPQNPYGLWDGSETSASRNWTAWRLADVFTANNPSRLWIDTAPANPVDWDNNGILDTNVVTLISINGATNRLISPTSELEAATCFQGLININGALRDNGAALQALVLGLAYEPAPQGAQATAGRSLIVANFVNAVRTHLAGSATVDTNPANDQLFWERGQISELATASNLPLFSSALSTLAGVPLNTAQDRGREELVRRIMDLITTKGNTYTVYAVGQSLNPRTGLPVATHRVKKTFRINPSFLAPDSNNVLRSLPADSTFNPAETGRGGAADRFRRPTGFTTTILHTSPE